MFKAFTPYALAHRGVTTTRMPFTPCMPTQMVSIGFGKPLNSGIETVIIERKSVPGDVVKRRVNDLAALCERETGRKPGKAWRSETKDAVVLELLPHAFPKRKEVPICWLDDHVLVGSTSNSDTDLIVSLLVGSEDGLAIALADGFLGTETVTRWVTEADDVQPDFELGSKVTLSGEDGTVAFKDWRITRDEVRELARRNTVASIALSNERAEFVYEPDTACVKSLSFIGIQMTGDADADCVLTRDALATLVKELRGAA